MLLLPPGWWDQILDGEPWHVNLDEIRYPNLATFRAAAYRQAENRRARVTTHKVSVSDAYVQAYGGPGMLVESPNLAAHLWTFGKEVFTAAPPVSAFYPNPERHATLDQVLVATPAIRAVEELTDDELLGPCTCGLAPICLPTCARAN